MPPSTQFDVICTECDEEIVVSVVQIGNRFEIQPFEHICEDVIDDDDNDDEDEDDDFEDEMMTNSRSTEK